MGTVIRLENLVKEYQQGDRLIRALNGVDLEIGAGEFVAIMGPSGCGKSTMMHTLGFLLSPTSGRYWFDGEDASQLTEEERANIRNTKIGFVFQSFNLLPRTSVLDNIMLPTEYSTKIKKAEAKRRALELIERVGLSHRIESKPSQLSGGETQRAALARALINQPSLILADEPTGNLDSKTSDEVMALITELNGEGNTIVMVTHEEDVADYARRIIRMKDGKIVSQ